MPVLDGGEATREIRGMERAGSATIPSIAMTADVFQDEKEDTFRAGINDYLTKPIDDESMYNCLKKYLSL